MTPKMADVLRIVREAGPQGLECRMSTDVRGLYPWPTSTFAALKERGLVRYHYESGNGPGRYFAVEQEARP